LKFKTTLDGHSDLIRHWGAAVVAQSKFDEVWKSWMHKTIYVPMQHKTGDRFLALQKYCHKGKH